MNSSRLEHPVWYPDPDVTGWKPDAPGEILHPLTRYLFALTLTDDFLPSERRSYLDYGCGTGLGTELVAPAFQLSTGVDSDPVVLDYARRIHNRAGTLYAEALDQTHAPYDYVTMLEVIEHMIPEQAVDLMHWLVPRMTPASCLFLTTPIATTRDGQNPHNPYHAHEYQPGELKEFLERYFAVVKINQVMGNFLHARCVTPRRNP